MIRARGVETTKKMWEKCGGSGLKENPPFPHYDRVAEHARSNLPSPTLPHRTAEHHSKWLLLKCSINKVS